MKRDPQPRNAPRLMWICPDSLINVLCATQWVDTTRELRELGWDVTMVAAGPAGYHSIRGVEVLCIPKPQIYLLRQVVFHIGLLRLLASRWTAIDVILFHQMSAPWVLCLRLVRRLTARQRPLFVMDTRDVNRASISMRDRVRQRFLELTHWMANRFADGQTAITQRMAELVYIPSQQLWGTWPSGVNPDRFALAHQARQWPSDGESIHLIYIGDLSYDRNLISICQSIEQANAEGMAFTLSIVGEGTDRLPLERFARKTAGRIRILPPVPHEQISSVLAQAHIGVTGLPLAHDRIFQASSPLKLLEYMAAGLPILAPRNVCYTDVVGSGEFVFWAEEPSVQGLVVALHRVWQQRTSLSEMGARAAIGAQAWTWREAAKKLKAALEYGIETSMLHAREPSQEHW
jgi:glycosyltransferase involved in cell wall biosynthesis